MSARRSGLYLCAALVGLGGLGLETLLLSTSVLALGFGRAGAIGLGAWVAAWALGALGASRLRAGPEGASNARLLWRFGLAVPLCGLTAIELMLFAGRSAISEGAAGALALAALALAALPQGAFLPLLTRSLASQSARELGALLAASLAGSMLGAVAFSGPLPGALGIPGAVLLAGLASALAGLIGARLSRTAGVAPRALARAAQLAGARTHATRAKASSAKAGRANEQRASESLADRPSADRSSADGPSARLAGLTIGLATLWMIGLEWVCLRLSGLWSGGMQPAIGALIAASLLALALGSCCLPALLPRGARGLTILFGLASLGNAWPIVAAPALEWCRLAGGRELALACVLCLPALAAFGAILPCVHGSMPGESGRRLGSLLAHEAWGAALGAPLVHWVLVPRFGLGGSLGVLGLAGLALAALWLRFAPRPAWSALALASGLVVFCFQAREPALASPKLSAPEFELLAFREDSDFAVSVVDDGLLGERTLLTDEFRATGTGDDYLYMRALGHIPLLLHPDPRRVAVLAFGTGTTAGAVSLHPEVRSIEVLELSPAVISFAGWFEEVNHGVLGRQASPPPEAAAGGVRAGAATVRASVTLGDGRRSLANRGGRFDVITMEPLLPDSPFAVYLYTADFYRTARRALAPGGLLCQWVPPHALEARTFDAVVDAFARAFPWSGFFLSGTQLVLVGGAAAPELDPGRFPSGAGESGESGESGAAEGISQVQARLRAALSELGLETPEALASRFVASGRDWPLVARPLTDADPWIIYARRERGALALGDLPTNLGRLRALAGEWPESWAASLGAPAQARRRAVRELQRLREDWEAARAARAGWPDPEASLRWRWFSGELAGDPIEVIADSLRGRLPGDPELASFLRLVHFERSRTSAFLALAAEQDREALELALEAASLRPRRGDVHLLVGLAAQRLGQHELARKALEQAFARCPRLLETAQGRAIAGLEADPGWIGR